MPEPPSNPPPRRRTFGIGSLLLVMTIFSFMGAAVYYLVQAMGGDVRSQAGLDNLASGKLTPAAQLVFLLVVLAGPLLLLVAASVVWNVLNWLARRP